MMLTKNKVYYASDFDPITNNDIKIINKFKKNKNFELVIIENKSIESYENRKSVINFIFKNKVKIIDHSKISNDSKVYSRKKINIDNNCILVDENNNLGIKFDSITEEDIINFNNYKRVNRRIRSALLYNFSYFDQRVKSLMDEKRFIHSLNVGTMAKEIAINNNYKNPIKALIAGTLHDIAKRFSEEDFKKYLVDNKLFYLLNEPKPVLHSYVGGLYLKNKWLIYDKEITNAVFFHTVGRKKMTLLEKIVFCADKVSKERNYNGVEFYRSECLSNIDKGFLELLKNQYDVVRNKNGDNGIGAMLLKTYKYYFN